MRNPVFGILLMMVLAGCSFAQPHVVKATAVPEPGVLVALGGGLVGLASVVRNRFNR